MRKMCVDPLPPGLLLDRKRSSSYVLICRLSRQPVVTTMKDFVDMAKEGE
jgi:hypothetical protein